LSSFPIVIIAGGEARRFGADKRLAMLGGTPVLGHVIDRLRPQTKGVIAINSNSMDGLKQFCVPVFPDDIGDDIGPLAGLHAALKWAKTQSYSKVMTVPSDTPFLPLDLVSKLSGKPAPTIAISPQGAHPLTGIWPVNLIDELDSYIESGKRKARRWSMDCRAERISFNSDAPFMNINTEAELEQAEKLLALQNTGAAQ